jgi:hypothetical protein
MKRILGYLLTGFAGAVVIYTIEGAATTVIGFSQFEDTPLLVKLLVPLVTIGTISIILFPLLKKVFSSNRITKE